MEEIILPIEESNKGEKINPDAGEINIAKLLSCSKRTIKSYIEKGILPKPISEKDGIFYFSKDAVVEALGLKNLDEVLVSLDEARKILGKSIDNIESLAKNGRLTEIKLKGFQSKRFYLKSEIEEIELEIEIDNIKKQLMPKRENRLIKIIFSEQNIELLRFFLTIKEIDIIKKVYVDRMTYQEIGDFYGMTMERSHKIFDSGMKRLERAMKNIVPLIRRREEKIIFDYVVTMIENDYDVRFNELEKKISYLNSLIEKAEDSIVIPQKLVEIYVPDDFAPHLPDVVRKLLKTNIKEFNFSVRLVNCLHMCDVDTVEEIVQLSEKELLLYRNFGKKSLEELKEFFKTNGLEFGMNLNGLKKVNYDKFVSNWLNNN